MNEKETALILRPEQALLDVTDKSLYSFNERESMAKFREASTVMALNRFFSLADSEAAQLIVGIAEKVPHLKNTFDSLKGKTELVVKMSEEARKKLESGEWHWVLASDGSGMLPSMKDAAEHFAGQIRVGQKTIHPDVINSLIGLTQKNNLDALTDKVIYLTDIVERISAGQYNDRVAMFYGARQMYIEAMGMNDTDNRRIALLNAAKSANEAIASLQQSIRYDLNNLANVKSGKQLDESTKLIAKCFAKLNDSVQISVNVYAALGENRALLASRGPERLVGICIDKGYKFPLNQCFKAYLFFIFNSLKCLGIDNKSNLYSPRKVICSQLIGDTCFIYLVTSGSILTR
jgi:hypothetical protein